MARVYTFSLLTDTHRGGGASSTGGRKLPLVYECVVTPDPDTPGDDGVATTPQVIDALGVQHGYYLGVPHPHFSQCLCTNITADMDPASLLYWTVTLTFQEPRPVPGTIPGGSPDRPAEQTANPEPPDRPPSFRVSYQRVPFSAEKDRNGKPFKNAAGDWLENPPELNEGMAVLQVKKWYAVDDWNIFDDAIYLDAINLNSWVTPVGTCGQYQARIEGLESELKTERGRLFVEVTFRIWCYTGEKKWYPVKCLNIGPNVIDATGKKVAYQEKATGRPLSGRTLLKADGTELPAGDAPTFEEFDVYTPLDFHATLGI